MADSRSGADSVGSSKNMKLEETANQTKHENEENKNGSTVLNIDTSRICSPSLLSTTRSRMVFNSPLVLRPSQLNGNTSSNTLGSPKPAFLLNPSRLNPFARVVNDDKSVDEQKEKQIFNSSSSDSAPKFLPLIQNGNKSESKVKTTSVAASTSSLSQTSDFVFGQNIQDRVVSDSKGDDAKLNNCTNANGTTDMLFSSALKENSLLDTSSSSVTQGTKSLSESAREYEESRAVKRKYEEVEVKTGEEEETNILRITCKLFAFDKAGGSWQERGRGTLRLNDQEIEESTHSRLVFRTSGSFRVVLNTKIWAEMTVQLASDKSVRLTAFDKNGEVKVFLLTGQPEDIKSLHQHLEVRIKREITRQKSSKTPDLLVEVLSKAEPDIKKFAGTPPDN